MALLGNRLFTGDVANESLPVTITAGNIYVVWGLNFSGPGFGTNPIASVTGPSGLTFTRTYNYPDDGTQSFSTWVGRATTSTSGGTITVGTGSGTVYMAIDEISGVSGNYIQTSNVKGSSATITATLSSFASSSNLAYVVTGAFGSSATTCALPSGYTTIANAPAGGANQALFTSGFSGGVDLAPHATRTGVSTSLFSAFELPVASGGGAPVSSMMLMGVGY